MQIKDPAIINAIKELSEYYSKNVSNRFTARALASIQSDSANHALLGLLTESTVDYQLQGLDLEELYLRIHAAARLVQQVRTQVMPNIRNLIFAGGQIGQSQSVDRTYRNMAVANFGPNLEAYSDKLKQLYTLTYLFDQRQAGEKPMTVQKFPDLKKQLSA